MRIFDYLEMLKLFDRLVESESTGAPSEFASRLNISRTTLYEIIDELRSRDIHITYSRIKRTFYYEPSASSGMKNVLTFDLRVMTEQEMKKIDAGMQIISVRTFLRTEE